MRYVIVAHSWFVHSKGFKTKLIDAKSDKAAHDVAIAFRKELDDGFTPTDTVVIKIGSDKILLPHKLSWRERLSGYIQ